MKWATSAATVQSLATIPKSSAPIVIKVSAIWLFEGLANKETVGHTKVRCKEPPKQEEGGDFGASNDADDFGGAGADDSNAAAAPSGGDDWENAGNAGNARGDEWGTAAPAGW